jgi:hypothetical protein
MKVNLSKYPKGKGERKLNVEIEDFDTWGLDHTLATIILPALIQLKHTKHGVPGELVERVGGDMDSNGCFDFIKEDENEVFNQLCNRWDEILDKMIWSFLQLSIEEDYDDLYHHGKMETDWVESEYTYTDPVTGKTEKTYQMVDKNPDEHWYDHVGNQEHDRRVQEGLDLFSKYFRNLWD